MTPLLPVVVKVQTSCTTPELVVLVRVTADALRLQALPPFWLREIVPVNPLTAVTDIVELAGEPALITRLLGPGETV